MFNAIKAKLYRYPLTRGIVNRVGRGAREVPASLKKRILIEQEIVKKACHPIEYAPPETASSYLSDFPDRKPVAQKCPTSIVANTGPAWLVGEFATPVFPNGNVSLGPFRDSRGLLSTEPRNDLTSFVEAKAYQSNNLDTQATNSPILSLVNRLQGNYYHWIIEWLPRIEAARTYEKNTGHQINILIPHNAPPFIRESLSLVGFQHDRLINWNQDSQPLYVENLIIAPMRGVPVAPSPSSIRWLQNNLAPTPSNSEALGDLIYIPRPTGGWRYITNQDEFTEKLSDLGFKIFSPEKISLADQINQFSQARCILGLHGAGLANIIFAPHVSLIEIRGSYGNHEFCNLAKMLNHPYRSIAGIPIGDNVEVDITATMKIITDIIAPPIKAPAAKNKR